MKVWTFACLIWVAAGAVHGQLAPEGSAVYGERGPRVVSVRGTTDIDLFEPVLTAFAEASPGLRIVYEQWASNDLYEEALAACRGELPVADLLISSSIDQQVKLVNDGCAQSHASVATLSLPAGARWRDEIFGVTAEPAVIVYNRALVPPDEVPRSRFELIDLLRPADSRYAGRVATYDIEESGLGYLFSFVDSQQATTFGSLIEAFGRSGAVATCCSAEIIEGVAEGKYLVAYNVLGSYALARQEQNPGLGVVAPSDYTLLLSRAVLIPKRAENADDAGRLIDFMLSAAGREALRRTHLIVDVGGEDTAELRLPEGDTALRPIPLSPVLLVGLDRQTRQRALALWRATFTER